MIEGIELLMGVGSFLYQYKHICILLKFLAKIYLGKVKKNLALIFFNT